MTAPLGAIRAAVTAILVLASALGPGVAGLLIDRGVPFTSQIAALGVYCLAVSLLMQPVVRRLRVRAEGQSGAAPGV